MAGIVLGGIQAEVMVDGYEKGNGADGPWRRIAYRVDWADSDRFMDLLKGVPAGTGVGSLILYPIPHAYPGNPNIVCVECAAVPFPPGIGMDDPKLFATPHKAIVTATYARPRWDIGGTEAQQVLGTPTPIPFARVAKKGSVEMVRVPASLGKQQTTGDPIDKDFYLRVPNITLQVERTMIPLPDDYDNLLESLVGKINAGTYLGKAEGTVLFADYDTDWEVFPDGSHVKAFNLELTWRSHDWNSRPMDQGGVLVWDRIQDTGSNYGYPYADLSPILTFGLS